MGLPWEVSIRSSTWAGTSSLTHLSPVSQGEESGQKRRTEREENHEPTDPRNPTNSKEGRNFNAGTTKSIADGKHLKNQNTAKADICHTDLVSPKCNTYKNEEVPGDSQN